MSKPPIGVSLQYAQRWAIERLEWANAVRQYIEEHGETEQMKMEFVNRSVKEVEEYLGVMREVYPGLAELDAEVRAELEASEVGNG